MLLVVDSTTSAEVWVFAVAFGVGIATFFPNGMGIVRRHFNMSALEQSSFSVAAAIGLGLIPAIAGVCVCLSLCLCLSLSLFLPLRVCVCVRGRVWFCCSFVWLVVVLLSRRELVRVDLWLYGHS